MKKVLLICTALVAVLTACNDGRYIDLNTGKRLELKKDAETGLMVSEETGKPVDIYVDTQEGDTVWGRTGKVVNGRVRKNNSGVYVYSDGNDGDNDGKMKQTEDEYKVKSGDYKKEVEKDGDVTIKDGNTKIKIDGETGKKKVKKDD